jgi:hypothetical protein
VTILVNVTQTYPLNGTAEDQLASIEGVWPVHGVSSLDAFMESDNAAGLLDAADLLIAARRNEIVKVRRVVGNTVGVDGRVTFRTIAASEFDVLVGRRLAAPYAWRRGQGWPVQTADLGEDVAVLLETLVEPAQPDPVQVVEIGGVFEVTLTADGNLSVVGPRGRTVSVTSR